MHDGIQTTFRELIDAGHLQVGDGYRTKQAEHGQPGLPILRVAEVIDGRIDPKFEDFVSDDYRPAMGQKISRPGDIVLTTKGTVGRVAMMPTGSPEFVYSPQVCFFRAPTTSSVVSQYLFYWFKSEQFWSQARSLKGQTDMADYINLADIRSLRILTPPKSVQDSIVAVLGAVDDKIGINDRIAQEADELRALRLCHWEQLNRGMTETRPLSAFADFVNGRAFTKDATGTGRMVIRIAEINSGPGASTVYNDIDVPDAHLARPGDVLFAWSGSLAVARWYRPEAIINQHIFKALPTAGVPTWLVFELIQAKLADFKGIAAGKATTMGHIQRRHLDEPVLAPKQERMASLNAELGPLWDRALVAEQESLTLVELRDTLLPKLMSGEIRVRDAERVVEGAT